MAKQSHTLDAENVTKTYWTKHRHVTANRMTSEGLHVIGCVACPAPRPSLAATKAKSPNPVASHVLVRLRSEVHIVTHRMQTTWQGGARQV